MTPLTLRQRPLLCPDLRRSTAFHPVLARVYATRVTDPTDLRLGWEALPPFNLLTDLDRAAHRLADVVQGQEQVVIAGDYDADGATATAVLIRAIRSFGGLADFVVPDRITEG